jgi:hypothetical protein
MAPPTITLSEVSNTQIMIRWIEALVDQTGGTDVAIISY